MLRGKPIQQFFFCRPAARRQKEELAEMDGLFFSFLHCSSTNCSFHSQLFSSQYEKGPPARLFFFLFFSSPIRKSELKRKEKKRMSEGSHQSVHLPQIQIKLTHRFVFVYNSWLAAYTVIILFNSINWFHEFNQSMKQKRNLIYWISLGWVDWWNEWNWAASSIKKWNISLIAE